MKCFLTIAFFFLINSHLHAATWYVKEISTGNALISFNHHEGGELVDLVTGPVRVFYSDIIAYGRDGSTSTYYQSLYRTNDDRSLQAAAGENPAYVHLVMDFSSPLTAAGGTVDLGYMALAWDGNWCHGDGLCAEFTEANYVVTTLPPVPLPGAAWLFLSAMGGLGAMRRLGKFTVRNL